MVMTRSSPTYPGPRKLTVAPGRPQPPEPEESPTEPNLRKRFVPLAEARTSAVIAALDYLGQLSQRARYRYTDAEVDTIEAAIFEKLTETMEAFRRGQGNKPGFTFRGAREEG
jgi:hypothetical protein